MTQTDFEERIPKGVPEGVRVAHKIGTEKQVIADGGIVYGKNSYILVILSDGVLETEALKALPEISGIVWEVVNAE
jgi:beta-lactamase class A